MYGCTVLACVPLRCVFFSLQLSEAYASNKILVHYCSTANEKRANALLLLGSYMVAIMRESADDVASNLNLANSDIKPYRDALNCQCHFGLSIHHCLRGLELAISVG